MQTSIYSNTYALNFTQCYANGHLKYSELSNLLQLTASNHAELLGFGYREMSKNFQSWVLSRVRIEIERLPRFLEEITVQTWVQDFFGNRSIRNFDVYAEDKKIIGASSFWAVFNIKDRKSENLAISIDPRVILSEKTATKEPFRRIDIHHPLESTFTYTPKLSDLDIVNHVNNVKYTDWCLDALPPEIVLKEHFKAIDINYLKELKLGQTVALQYQQSDTEISFAISRDNRPIFLMHVTK
ncbi:acyl-[acyl-carrier-protein] thioesterase [Sphingobacterium suaedae]|uniref:Acyl-[acyl-carrier-protein] thioesterase n=1 Tax=Sphingobacterium suaedae TaxID=1686402 RepID=A0ABW5KH21_9SPHI